MARDKITDKSNPPKSEWFGYKYRVTPEISKLLQEAVFKDGGGWGFTQQQDAINTDKPFLIVRQNKEITCTADADYFERHVRLPEKQPPLPQEFKVGKYYKCVEDRKDLRKGDWYKVVDIVSSVGQPILKIVNSKGSYLKSYVDWFDINSESDYDPNTAQPSGYTAYVVFKQDHFDGYGSKEYTYKCSRDDYTQWVEYRAFDEDVFAEVNVNGVEKKVKVVRVEAKVDPKATKSIVRILPKELAIEKKTSRINNIIKVTINRDDFFSKDDVNTVIKHFNQREEIGMSTTQRKVVKVELFDNDTGLPVENSLVFYKADVITEDSDSVTVQEIIASGEIAKLITKHNELRGKTTDLEVQKRTGQSVKLQPIKLKNLVWKVDGRIVG